MFSLQVQNLCSLQYFSSWDQIAFLCSYCTLLSEHIIRHNKFDFSNILLVSRIFSLIPLNVSGLSHSPLHAGLHKTWSGLWTSQQHWQLWGICFCGRCQLTQRHIHWMPFDGKDTFISIWTKTDSGPLLCSGGFGTNRYYISNWKLRCATNIISSFKMMIESPVIVRTVFSITFAFSTWWASRVWGKDQTSQCGNDFCGESKRIKG